MIRRLLLIAAILWGAIAAADEWPPYVVEWPSATGDVLVAETGSYTLFRYSRADDGSVHVDSEPMSIGRKGGGKQREGDLLTPYGVFFIVDRLDTTPLHAKYGSAAFPLDYPSARDVQLGRTGSGIWLHGVLPGTNTPIPRDTDGCIAINNAALDALAPRLNVHSTPVIVTRSLDNFAADWTAALRDELVAMVGSWASSFLEGRSSAFVEHYAAGFSYRGLDLDAFMVLQSGELTDGDVAQVAHRELFIAADPNENGVFISRFILEIELRDGVRRELRKRLYWQRDAAGAFKVIAEDEA